MTGSCLEIRANDTISSTGAAVELDSEVVSARDLQKAAWMPDQLGTLLLRALRTLSDGVEATGDLRATLVEEHDISLLDGLYVTAAARAVRTDLEAARFLSYTRHLGGTISADIRTSLDDVEQGPVRILDAAGLRPTLVVEVTHEWWETTKSTQRRRLFDHLHRLTPGVDVQITGTRLQLRRLLKHHADEFGASVIERAHQSVMSGSHSPVTRTEQVRNDAQDLLTDLGTDHVDWPRLATLLEPTRERRSYDDLEADVRLDLSRDGVKQFARRCQDRGLITKHILNNQRHLRLTRVGRAALEMHPDIDIDDYQDDSLTPPDRWNTEHTSQESKPQDDGGEIAGVRDPRNDDASTVLSHTHGKAPPDRPDEEGSVAAAGGSDERSRSHLSCSYLRLDEHHAAAAAAPSSGFTLSTRPLDDRSDYRAGSWSYDDDRNEVVTRVRASTLQAFTMTRSCAALASDKAFNQVLTPENLDGGPAKTALRGLAVSNDYVLRGGACLGWLAKEDATGKAYQQRLQEARNELLEKAGELDTSDVNEELASQVLRKALGLFGTLVRVYDLLGIDVICELEVPSHISCHPDGRPGLTETLTRATACASRYGVYSANRLMYEPREVKREQTIGTPDTNEDPVGTLNPRWVLSGPDVDRFQEDLDDLESELDLQEHSENFAKFLLRADVVDGNRREAVASVVSRLLSFGDIEETRTAISLFRTFLSNTLDVARALYTLDTREDDSREIDLVDTRSALAMFADDHGADRLLEDVGDRVVSEAVGALLDTEKSLSTAELADLADVSSRSLTTDANSEAFDVLEEVGLLEREDQGSGKATLWRLCLPYRAERFDSSAPTPRVSVGNPDASYLDTTLNAVLFDLLATLADEYSHDLGIDWGGSLVLTAFEGPRFTEADAEQLLANHPHLEPVVSLLVALLDEDLPVGSIDQWIVELGADPNPDTTQASLQSAASAGG